MFSVLALELFSMVNMTLMNKQTAIDIFGNAAALSRAIGVTRSAISQWPDTLEQSQMDRVVGAAIRHGLADKIPEPYRSKAST